MKRNVIAILMLTFSVAGFSQSLQDQISAVNQIQNENKANEKAAVERAALAERIRQADAEKRQAARDAHERQLSAEKLAQADRENARAMELEKAKIADMQVEKSRDQSYEDELRKLELEEKKIALAEKKAKADRANDYIDQDLKQKAASTDVIQSNADVNRNISEGGKALLTSEGKAKEKEASRLFK